jgi:hypothetical protein
MKQAGWLVAALAVGSAACDDTTTCTLELRTAVVVTVTAADGVVIDRVTAERGNEYDCETSDDPAVGPATYSCHEQGGSTYTIRVYSGARTWTREVEVEETADGCHVAKTEELAIDATPETAD